MNQNIYRYVLSSLFVSFVTLSACSNDSSLSEAQTFELSIENISQHAGLLSPFAPGLWVLHHHDRLFFADEMNQARSGLENLAEDGDPTSLYDTLLQDSMVSVAGIFDTVEGAMDAGPVMPGQTYRVRFEARPEDGKFSFASMLVQSNDYFVSTGDVGISLFDDINQPKTIDDLTDSFFLYDAGTEIDEAPGMGTYQAPRQMTPDSGPTEGVVHRYLHPTRALPIATALVNISVSGDGDSGYTFLMENISKSQGVFVSPISPVFWALHDGSWDFYPTGQGASSDLERLAEDGSSTELLALATSTSSVGSFGVADTPLGSSEAGPLLPGNRYSFHVQADDVYHYLSLAAMVVQTNDVFLAPVSAVSLKDDKGQNRSASEIEQELTSRLALFDAGSEKNEVPGVGLHQAPRQAAPNIGDDEMGTVQRYADTNNDLQHNTLGGIVDITVYNQDANSLRFVITNNSDQSAFPCLLTPFVTYLQDGNHKLFTSGEKASMHLESLAEDGDGSPLITALEASPHVLKSQSVAVPVGETKGGPLRGGASYEFVLDIGSATHFNLIAMVVPSNDTFVSLGESGIRVRDENSGMLLGINDIQAAIDQHLSAWDAGTEINQASAYGVDQAPYQLQTGDGLMEGAGTVRLASENGWPLPDVSDLLRIRIVPVQ